MLCPVCQTEYAEGEVNTCLTCGWDVTPYPSTLGQIPEAFLKKQQVKLTWARATWNELQAQKKQFEQEKIQLFQEIQNNNQNEPILFESWQEILGEYTSQICQAVSSKRGTVGYYQQFENGSVYITQKYGIKPVWGSINLYYQAKGGTASIVGFPVTDEQVAANSIQGTQGVYQRFEGPWNYPCDIIENHLDGEVCGATIYYSEPYGAFTVGMAIGVCYETANGTGGILGFPTSEELDVTSSVHKTEGKVQRFENGSIYWSRKQSSYAFIVKNSFNHYYEAQGGAGGLLGFPVSPEIVEETGKVVQNFEGGVIIQETDSNSVTVKYSESLSNTS